MTRRENIISHGQPQPAEVQIVKVIEKTGPQKTEGESANNHQQKPLWAISRSGRLKARHLVTQASWGLSLDERSTK